MELTFTIQITGQQGGQPQVISGQFKLAPKQDTAPAAAPVEPATEPTTEPTTEPSVLMIEHHIDSSPGGLGVPPAAEQEQPENELLVSRKVKCEHEFMSGPRAGTICDKNAFPKIVNGKAVNRCGQHNPITAEKQLARIAMIRSAAKKMRR